MNIYVMPVGALQTNCYILPTQNGNAIVIDPGAEPERILAFLKEKGLSVKLIIFTHGHSDHIGGAAVLQEKTGAELALPALDEDIFRDPSIAGTSMFDEGVCSKICKVNKLYNDKDVFSLDEISLKAMWTPGHTKGSSILIGEDVIFSGDTLFAGSCGRTDLYGGSYADMEKSLQKIARLEGEYQVFPGHGEETSLSYEKKTNPYLGKNYDDIF